MTVVFADDFETGDLSLWTSQEIDAGCTLEVIADTVSPSIAASDYLLHAVKVAGTNIKDANTTVSVSGAADMWASFRFYLDSHTATSTTYLLSFLTTGTRRGGVRLGSGRTLTAVGPTTFKTGTGVLALDAWYLLELHLHSDLAAANSYCAVYVNGEVYATTTTLWTAAALPNQIRLGLEMSTSADIADAYFDDLNTETAQVGFPDIVQSTPPYFVGVYCGTPTTSKDWNFFLDVKNDLLARGIRRVSWNVEWDEIETAAGVYDYSGYDTALTAIPAYGFLNYVRVIHRPAFYADYSQVNAFIANLEATYNIAGVFLFNEPNYSYFDALTGETRPHSYADMMSTVSTTAPLYVGNLAGVYLDVAEDDYWAIDTFVAELVAQGASGGDYLGIHNYPGSPAARPPEWLFEWAPGDPTPQTIVDRACRTAYLNGLPYQPAITEVGWLIDGTETYPMTEAKQAKWTVRNVLHGLARGIHLHHSMFLRDITIAGGDSEDNRKGLYDDDHTAREAVIGLGFLGTLFWAGASFVQAHSLGSYNWGYEFTTGILSVIACWTQDGEIYHSSDPAATATATTAVSVPVGASSSVWVFDIDGTQSTQSVTAGSVTMTLTNEPQYIVWVTSGGSTLDFGSPYVKRAPLGSASDTRTSVQRSPLGGSSSTDTPVKRTL